MQRSASGTACMATPQCDCASFLQVRPYDPLANLWQDRVHSSEPLAGGVGTGPFGAAGAAQFLLSGGGGECMTQTNACTPGLHAEHLQAALPCSAPAGVSGVESSGQITALTTGEQLVALDTQASRIFVGSLQGHASCIPPCLLLPRCVSSPSASLFLDLA